MIEEKLSFIDELGPSKVIQIYAPRIGLKAFLVVDNVAAGPAIGGIRMAPDATKEEAFRLARAMTLKNAAAGLPHGGGKSVIIADPKMPLEKKEELIRAFAVAIKDVKDYIPGPDMGTNEHFMALIKNEINRCIGLPREVGGIPLDEIGATGLGVKVAAQTAYEMYRLDIKGARVVIQGFGAVGYHSARFLTEMGAIVVAVSDSKGTIIDPEGLPLNDLYLFKKTGKSVSEFADAKPGDVHAIVGVECDIWIPAARPDVINMDNVDRLRTGLIVQGANIPITVEAEGALFKKGIHSIPDFIANAGGVICAAVEYSGGTENQALEVIEEKVSRNTKEVIEASLNKNISIRDAALEIAQNRVIKAMSYVRGI